MLVDFDFLVVRTRRPLRTDRGERLAGTLVLRKVAGGGVTERGVSMAMERNGVVFYDPTEKNEDHPAFKALKSVSLGDVRFPFGFFLIERNGERYVLPGTKDDLLKALLTAFPDYPTQSFSGGCGSIWDMCTGGCGDIGITFTI